MAKIPKRTFFVSLVVISGLLYFLYAVYVSDSNKQLHSSVSRNKVLGKLLYSSSNRPNSLKTEIKDIVQQQGIFTRNIYDPGFIQPSTGLCPDFGSKLQVVIIIASAPKHTELRTAIRQTWGHYNLRKDIAIGFIVGRTLDNVAATISQENELYEDVIQANFIDSYDNLTLKSVSMLEWVDHYCHEAKFVFKTDDDMFINVPKLLSFISNHSKDKRKIFGRLAQKWEPIRKKSSKYYTSFEQYSDPLLPDFTTGGGYLITGDVIHEMYMTALDKKFLKLEDVYTTGIVAEERKIQRIDAIEFCNQRDQLSPCNIQNHISIHDIKT